MPRIPRQPRQNSTALDKVKRLVQCRMDRCSGQPSKYKKQSTAKTVNPISRRQASMFSASSNTALVNTPSSSAAIMATDTHPRARYPITIKNLQTKDERRAVPLTSFRLTKYGEVDGAHGQRRKVVEFVKWVVA